MEIASNTCLRVRLPSFIHAFNSASATQTRSHGYSTVRATSSSAVIKAVNKTFEWIKMQRNRPVIMLKKEEKKVLLVMQDPLRATIE